MPFIHIKSLPFDPPLDIPPLIAAIGRDFAQGTGVPLNHVHTTWEYFLPGHFAKGEDTPATQREPHSVLVNLLTPDFNDATTVRAMLVTLADSIAKRSGHPRHKIFINHRAAHSSMVFDDGEVVEW